MENFVTLLKALLVDENGYSTENAERMVSAHPDVVSTGIMHGNSALRATVIALEMRESDTPNAGLDRKEEAR